jgi:polysaccharide biosynthesis transport protein
VPNKLEPELKVFPDLINRYLGFIAIVPISQTRLVNIQSTTPDPALSQALANAHVQTFMRMSEENRFSLTQVAQEFLEQKKTELQKKLQESEEELNRFERANNVLSVGKGENIVVDRLVDLNKQLTAARAQCRIDGLVKSLEAEISQPDIRLRFQTKIAAEIRNLEDD